VKWTGISSANQRRVVDAIRGGIPKAVKTIGWLLKLIIPISLAVRLLQYTGLLEYIAHFLHPVFQAVGLPGASAIAFVCSLFLPLYAPIAIIGTLHLTIREISILAIMCLISHNTLFESAVQKKTGSSFWFVWCLRVVMSFVAAFIWNLLLPEDMGMPVGQSGVSLETLAFWPMLLDWGMGALKLCLIMALVVTALMILQRLMEAFYVMDWLAHFFAPFMRVMGLSKDSSFLWFVANIVGLTYGSAILIEQMENKRLNVADARMLNNHLAISHSLLEDTMLFVAIGVPLFWVTVPRVLLAMAVVWVLRLLRVR